MTPTKPQYQATEDQSDQDTGVVELTLNDLESVAGGPQIINDGMMPP